MSTDFGSHSNSLPRTDVLLGGFAEAARRLLTIANFDAGIDAALEAIGIAAGVDRVFVYQHHLDTQTQREFASCPYEWTVTGIVRSCDLPGQYPMFYDEIPGFVDWVDELKAGRAVQRLAHEMSAAGQAKQVQEQALSVLTVPIFVEGEYWGSFGFDDCTTARVWSEAAIAVLETAAACIGSAIERDRDRQAREAAARDRAEELEAHNRELTGRDRLLSCVNAATRCLVAQDDFGAACTAMLKVLGEGTQQCRAYLLQISRDAATQDLIFNLFLEWDAADIPPKQETGGRFPVPVNAFPDRLTAPLQAGQSTQFLARELDGIPPETRMPGQARSLVGVPIFIAGEWWGLLGLDDCLAERVWSDAEIAVLATAATALANAVERDRARKTREAAAQARAAELEAHNQVLAGRDRILKATAEASNLLLTEENFDTAVNSALRLLGESVGCDRAFVAQQLDDPTGQTLGVLRILYEWDSPGISSQTGDHDNLRDISWEDWGIADWFYRNQRGEAFGATTDDFSERFGQFQTLVGTQSVHNIPIFVEGHFWGCVGTDHCREKKLLTEAELAVFKTAADCIGSAIERNRARKEREAMVQSRSEELLQVNSILQTSLTRLASEPDLNAFLGNVTHLIRQSVGAFSGYVFLYDAEARTLALRLSVRAGQVCVGASAAEPDLFQAPFPADITPVYAHLCETRAVGLFSLYDPEAGLMWPGNAEWLYQSGFQEVAAAALMSGDRPVGMLGLTFKDSVVLSPEDLDLIRALADQASLAIQLANLAEDTKQTAILKERGAVAQVRAAELEAHNQALAERDRILEATAAAANVMLTDDNFESAVKKALQIIGEGLTVDRVNLLRHFETEQEGGYHQVLPNEWVSPGTMVQAEHPQLFRISDEGIEVAISALQQGEVFGGIVEELPEPFRSAQLALGVKSTYAVPVMLGGEYWGIVGIDDCHRFTHRSAAELEALRTLANCIGSAIEREQLRQLERLSRKAREAAERTALLEREQAARAADLEAANQILRMRDRWLDTTAIATKQLLSVADIEVGVNTALQTIGTNLGSDRLGVMRHIPDGTELGCFQILYEWDASGMPCQLDMLAMNPMPASDFADWTRKLMADQAVGGPIAEQAEPFRSQMQSLGNLSAYAVPIFIERDFWGLMFMDYCRELGQLTPAELAVFRTAATCIGSAIHREQMRRERAEAERDALLQQEQERAAQERARLLRNVAEVANLLLRSADYTTVLPEVVRLLGESVGSDRCSISQDLPTLSPETARITMLAEWHAQAVESAAVILTELVETNSVLIEGDFFDLHRTLLAGGVINCLVQDLPEAIRDFWEIQNITSISVVPIMVQGVCWGEISFDNCGEPRLYDEAEIASLQVAADSIAAAIARQAQDAALRQSEQAILAEREKAAQERAAQLTRSNQALKRSLDSLAQQPDLDTFLQRVVDEAVAQTGAASGHLFFSDQVTRTCWLHVCTDNNGDWRTLPDMTLWLQPVPFEEAPAFWKLILEKQPVVVEDLQETLQPSPIIWTPSIAWHLQRNHSSFICAPLVLGDRVLGFLGLAFVDKNTIDQEDVELAQVQANQATLAIQLTRLAEQARTNALTDERNRLAREIHDTLAQAFTGVSLQLEAARSLVHQPGATPAHLETIQTYIRRARDLARKGLSEARRSVRALRSEALETDDLPDALRKALTQTQRDTHLSTHFYLEGGPIPLPDDIQLNLLRIAQEAITNTLRHADATQLDLTLYFASEHIQLRIVDNGIGFEPGALLDKGGFGIIGMRERAARFYGTFDLQSTPTIGTTLDIIIPLSSP